MKKFNCIFPGLYNYILTKDVGMIPYVLSEKYDSIITTYDNDNYTYMENILNSDNLEINYLENTGNERRDVTRYIRSNAGDIDFIEFYHLRYNLLPWYVFTYKLHNKKGTIHLKLDANNDFIDFLVKREGFKPGVRRLLVKILFKFIDVVSIETIRNYNVLESSNLIDNNKLLYLPNGVLKTDVDVNNKDKTILYVGSIEKKNKSIDLLLNAICNIELNDWKVVLIGEVKEDMTDFIDNFYNNNPELKDKIILKGYISDKHVLANEYAKSSIYCCTSSKESFGISTLEAAYHGNYIISTNVGGSPDIIEKTGYGKIIEHDKEQLENTLKNTIKNWDKIKENPKKIQKTIYEHFSWINLCKTLDNYMNR
ncbi:MAG: glycosyltransferase family 4 protein [Methanosphaera sp.]